MTSARPSRLRAAVLALMFLSGAAALIYEVVWLRMLSRTFGVTVYAVSALVAIYMGGLALGAIASTRLKKGNALRAYAWLEAAAGAAALLCTWILLRLPGVIASIGESPLPAGLRALIAVPALLPPTMLLGATLPVLTRFWENSESGSSPRGAGLLYGANTLGAMLGLIVAGFWTIGAFGETASVGLAAALNLAAAAGAFIFSRRAPVSAPSQTAESPNAAARRGETLVLWLFGASGFCALGYEILWSRQLVLILGNSTYAFSLLLAMYLAGIGLGSCLLTRWPEKGRHPLETFGQLEILLGALALTSLAALRILGMALDRYAYLYSPLQNRGDFPLLIAQAALMVLPASLAMGALFPAAVRACGGPSGASVGRLYAFNTFGGILGSLAAGFWGIAALGAHNSFLALAALNILIGLAALAAFNSETKPRYAVSPAAFTLLMAAALLAFFVRRDPTLDILRNRLKRAFGENYKVLFHDESPAATITGISLGESEGRNMLLINGIITSGNGPQGMLMSLIPDLLMESPKKSLVICFGAGGTFRAASFLGRAADAVELVGDVVRRMPYFFPDAPEHLKNPAHRVIIDDGRNYLLRTKRRYDSIVIDTTPPLYSAGAVNLYTKEFLALVRDHLTPDGIYTLWLPTYSFESDYWHIMKAMTETFPHTAAWTHPASRDSGIIYFGSSRPLTPAPGAITRRIRERGLQNLSEREILDGFVLTGDEMRKLSASYEAVSDDRPLTEFPLARFLRNEALQKSLGFIKPTAQAR